MNEDPQMILRKPRELCHLARLRSVSGRISASHIAVVMGTVVPVGLGVAAAWTAHRTDSERVGIAAWVATAVVGTATVISTARAMILGGSDPGEAQERPHKEPVEGNRLASHGN